MTDTKTATKPTPAADPVKLTTTTDLGKRFNMKPTYLRRILRSMTAYNDSVHTKYGWDETTKAGKEAIAEIAKEVARRKGAPSDKAMEAKASAKAAA